MAVQWRRSVRLSTSVAAVPIQFLVPGKTRLWHKSRKLAALIPGNGVLETTTIGGTATFFSIYQNVIGKLPLIDC